MQPLLESQVVLQLIVATLLGAALGFERSLAGKQAGMRTYAMVSLGAALFTSAGLLASYQLAMFSNVNPVFLAGYVIVGIGFIGSSFSAMRNDGDKHVELTTATGVWVVAGVGVAVGFGLYSVAFAATILAILVFSILSKVEHFLRVRYSAKYTETNNG